MHEWPAARRQQLRVTHICKVKGIAGAERHLLHLLPALAARGVDVRLLVLEDPRTPAGHFRAAARERALPVEIIPARRHADPRLVGRIARSLALDRPDVVHTHMLHGDLYGLAAARRAGIAATVSTRHDNNPFRRRGPIRWLNRRAMRHARRIIAISHSLAAFVRDVEGAPPESVTTIHYGVDVLPAADAEGARRARAALGCGPGDRLIGFVGRLVRQKGVDVLLEAFARVRADRPDVRLCIVGDGPLRATLAARAARLDVGAAISFAGWQENAAELMPAFDLMVVPSRWEGLGLVALEALARARPLVVSAVDALPEIVEHRRSGLIVPAGDPGALADAVLELLDDPAFGRIVGRAGHDRVAREFTIERMVTGTLQVYEDVVAATTGSPRLPTPREEAGSETGIAESP
jgi:glycosyltransferase involved in cell wall biosynthesis